MHATEQVEDWLRLQHTRGIGPLLCNRLLKQFSHDPDAILNAPKQQLIKHGFSAGVIEALARANDICVQVSLDWLAQKSDHHIVTQNNPLYPRLLKTCPDAPALLYVAGDTNALLHTPRLAFVGSRRCTRVGQSTAKVLAQQAADIGFCIVSGLAYGIDAAAHRAVVQSQGTTIAVLANGLDSVYPKVHSLLAQDIRQRGALLSEYPPASRPLAQHFPQRNRIISGLAFGTVVVEAAARSGSLITARHALEQGREVFCVPGAINNPLTQGCHHLIQQGAKLITGIEDIIAEFSDLTESCRQHNYSSENRNLDKYANSLLELIEYDPISIDEIIQKSGLTPEEVCSMLVVLEAAGRVICDTNGLYSQSTTDGN